jgi:hypothetical protein
VVNAWDDAADATSVSSHHAAPADLVAAAIPQQRVPEPAASEAGLEVREWRRLGRRCLFVEAADGRTVGILNVNTGVVTLTDEKERPHFEAAIIGWFNGAIDGPIAATELTIAPPSDPADAASAAEAPVVVPEPPAAVEVLDPAPAVEPIVEEVPASATPVEPLADEASQPAVAVESPEPGSRVAARARARREGPAASVRARFARILEEHVEETRRTRGVLPEQGVAPQQEQTHPAPAAVLARGVTVVDDEDAQPADVGRGRHRGRVENVVAPRREHMSGEPAESPAQPELRPTGGRHRAARST